ncbi:MAG: coproporphyrinogen-III oxidase family protein [Myxococcota bacterium]
MTAAPDIERIAQALGQAPRVAYAATHVYPWAAPAFAHAPRAERPRLPLEQLRLYVHVPFCNYGCTFCFYTVKVGAKPALMERTVAALEKELEHVAPGTPLAQLFMGGGTPTALPPELLDRLLAAIFARAPSLGSEVHTVEASPETLTDEHIAVLQRHGVGRVSMGVQSLDAGVLGGVHRRHSPAQAIGAIERLAAHGMIANVDLIYGLPGQSEASLRRDLEAVVRAGVSSVTLYDLRLNEHTPVRKALSDDERLVLERLVRWRRFVRDAAAEVGLVQTRWHTFKRPTGMATKHRRAPHFSDDGHGYQLGIGASARSQLGTVVYRNHDAIDGWLTRVEAGESPVEEVFALDLADRQAQFVARSLGDGQPLVRARFEAAFGEPIERSQAGAMGDTIARLVAGGLVADDGQALTLTEIGRLVYDRVTLCFYPEKARRWLMERALEPARPAPARALPA